MIGDDIEWATLYVRAELAQCPNYRQALLLCYRVVRLGFRQRTARVCYDVLVKTGLSLGKHGTEADPTSISVDLGWGGRVEVPQYRRGCE